MRYINLHHAKVVRPVKHAAGGLCLDAGCTHTHLEGSFGVSLLSCVLQPGMPSLVSPVTLDCEWLRRPGDLPAPPGRLPPGWLHGDLRAGCGAGARAGAARDRDRLHHAGARRTVYGCMHCRIAILCCMAAKSFTRRVGCHSGEPCALLSQNSVEKKQISLWLAEQTS